MRQLGIMKFRCWPGILFCRCFAKNRGSGTPEIQNQSLIIQTIGGWKINLITPNFPIENNNQQPPSSFSHTLFFNNTFDMQKNPPKSHHFRVSSHHTYQPTRTQQWKCINPKFSKHEILSSLSKIKQPNHLSQSQLESWKSNESKIIKGLEEEFDIEYLDKGVKQLVGPTSEIEFYKHHKKLPKIMDQNRYENISPSIYTNILKKSEDMGVLPLKFGIIKEKGTQNHINIEESLYGRKYMEVLLQGTQTLAITECNFNATRFSQYSKNKLLSPSQPLLKDIEILKLQKNCLSNSSIRSVHSLFQNTSKLVQLDLGNNRLNDSGVLNLCQILQSNSKIRILNLSKNGLTEKCIKGIISLNKANGLEEIYLQWNKISSAGGKQFLNHIRQSETLSLKILDLSWNLLGRDKELCDALEKLLKENKEELYHLNLSHNRFTKQECINISEYLNQNSTLYGFHFEGNFGYMDSKGYLKFDVEDKYALENIKLNPNLKKSAKQRMMATSFPSRQEKQIKSNSLLLKQKPLLSKLMTNQRQASLKNVCWLCEGWIEHQFILQLEDPQGQLLDKNIWIHFSFDNFEGTYIGKKTQRSQFSYLAMIPPSRFEFFWTLGEDQHLSSRYPRVSMKGSYSIKDVKMGDRVCDVLMESRNWYQTPNKKIYKEKELFPENVKPRTMCVEQVEENDAIDHETTLFKQSSSESFHKKQPQLKGKFQQEWRIFLNNQTVITCQEDILSCHTLFSQNYELIRDLYRHYGGYSDFGLNNIVMDSKSIKKLLQDYEVIEGEFRQDKIDEILLTMCGVNDDYCGMIEGVTRPAFIEVICRIVSVRYEGLDFVEGVQLILEVLRMNKSVYERFDKWRDRVLFLEGLHKQLKNYCKKFESLFRSLCKFPSPNATPLLPFTAFYKYFNGKIFFEKAINTIQIKRAAYYSQLYQDIDANCGGKTSVNLTFSQFVEAVARLAFVDEEGELVEEFSLSGRKERLQKIIDLILVKEH